MASAHSPTSITRASYVWHSKAQGRGATRLGADDDNLPELFIRGADAYEAHPNPENPIGTMQSIEHALRGLDKTAEQERQRGQRLEKALADYRAEANRPFEHEARLKDLLSRQPSLNALVDLDKGDRQVAEAAEDASEIGNDAPEVSVRLDSPPECSGAPPWQRRWRAD